MSTRSRAIIPEYTPSARLGKSWWPSRLRSLCRDSVRERRRRNGADRSARAGGRPVALLMDRAACEIEVLGADDDRAWPAGCEPIHRSGSEVRGPMHARDSGVPKDGAHQDGLQLRANNFDHGEVAHPESIAERASRPSSGCPGRSVVSDTSRAEFTKRKRTKDRTGSHALAARGRPRV